MTYCNEKQMPCEWAQIGGRCSVSACRKVLLTAGGWPMPTKQPEFVKPPMTNADRLNAMSIEEKAEFFAPKKPTGGFPWCKPVGKVRCGKPSCHECCLAWLQQPAEEVHHV